MTSTITGQHTPITPKMKLINLLDKVNLSQDQRRNAIAGIAVLDTKIVERLVEDEEIAVLQLRAAVQRANSRKTVRIRLIEIDEDTNPNRQAGGICYQRDLVEAKRKAACEGIWAAWNDAGRPTMSFDIDAVLNTADDETIMQAAYSWTSQALAARLKGAATVLDDEDDDYGYGYGI